MRTLVLISLGILVGWLLAPLAPFGAGGYVALAAGGIGLLVSSILPAR